MWVYNHCKRVISGENKSKKSGMKSNTCYKYPIIPQKRLPKRLFSGKWKVFILFREKAYIYQSSSELRVKLKIKN